MKAVFVDGPYQGIEIDHNDMKLYCRQENAGNRFFIHVPPRDKWDAVRDNPDLLMQIPEFLVYELAFTKDGCELRFDESGDRLDEAKAQGQTGIHLPSPPLQTFICLPKYKAKPDATQPEKSFLVRDDKDREWYCILKVEAEHVESVESFMKLLKDFTQVFGNVSIQYCESTDDLPAKLADFLD